MNFEPAALPPTPPPSHGSGVAFEDAFTFLFRRPRGLTVLMTGGILLLFFWLIIPGLVVMGYGIALGRGVASADDALPRFRLGQAVDGLKVTVVMFVYSIPIFVIYAAAFLPAFLASLGREEFATPETTVQFFGLIWLMMIYGLAMAFLQPALFAVYIATGRIGSCFNLRRFGNVISFWRGSYVAAAVIVFAMSQLVGVGVILLVVGIAFTAFYHLSFTMHVSGQLARPLVEQLGGSPGAATPYSVP